MNPIAVAGKLWRSLIVSMRGIAGAYRRDLSVRLEIWSLALFVLFGYLVAPLSKAEVLFLALAYTLMLIAELLNTSLEIALERLHPERHELIGASKDTASAAVFVAILFALAVAVAVALDRAHII